MISVGYAVGPDGSDFSDDQKKFSDVCRFDKEKAVEFWDAAKKELGFDTLNITMLVDDDDAPRKVSQVLKEQWETTLPGLTVELKTQPKKQRLNDMENDNFQMGLTRWGPDYADPMTYLGMWKTNNENNFGFWTNKDYDSILLDQPVVIQFFRYVGNMLRGDFGVSYNISKNTPISQLIAAFKHDTIFDTLHNIKS